MKMDLKKEYKSLYSASAKEAALVEVPELNYLMVDGEGDPNTSQGFQDAVEALYSLSYTLKFMFKKGPEALDYGVMPLEGLWWTEDMSQFCMEKREDWKWTLMILQPDFITPEKFQQALEEVKQKKDLPALAKVRLEGYREGEAVQILHIGPYAEEGPTIQKLHAFAREQGYQLWGKHHEIYLADPRRSAPEKLKTILRQPVRKEL